jgi:glycosyltransferase involved in cell wall biosynthesis
MMETIAASQDRDVPAQLAGYSAERPLVLLTDYPPETPGGGAVILQSLLTPEDRTKIVWLTPSRTRLEGRDVVWLRRGSSGRTRSQRRLLWLDHTVLAGALADEVVRIACERSAQALWIVMHGTAVAIAARLARRTSLAMHLTVHDDPAYATALGSRRYLALLPAIEHDFARAIRAAASVDVVSPAMADRYRRRYGVSSVVVHRGMDRAVEPSPPYERERWGLRVGILGNTYGYSQLLILGRAVARAAQELGVPGRLLVVGDGHGARLRRDLNGLVEVDFTGHIDEDEAVRQLQSCFVLYLNYPFSIRRAVLRRTSFPTKLSTYVQAARPLLVHAPSDSSVTPLGEMSGYATRWETLRPEDGAALLARIWADPQRADSVHADAEQVRARYFDHERNRGRILHALNRLVTPPGARHVS